jgi:hypothetical protein
VKSFRSRFDSTSHSLASLTWAIGWRRGFVSRAKKRHIRRLLIEPLEEKVLLSSQVIPDAPATTSAPPSLPVSLAVPLGGGTSFPAGLIPSQIRQAYGYNLVNFADGSSGDGSRQTIAIVDAYHDPNIRADLHAFDQQFGLGDPALTIADPDGVPSSPPPPDNRGFSWGLETTLDVEWAHALAPGAAILLVETPGTDFGLLDGVNFARSQPGVSVVSMSWGENTVINDAVFTTPPGHQGVTFVAGSGDAGSQADYPAFSPNVLAVGGTEFAKPLDPQGDYPGEAAWPSGGGGVGPTEPQPRGQLQAVGDLGGRAIPDVSFDAGSDVAVLDSYDYGANPWISLEGTSFGAPAWAALIAVADQGRELADAGSLDGGTQTIPGLYAIAGSGAYGLAFHDITAGRNDAYAAKPGFDLVTGLGTPNAPLIVASLSHNLSGLHLIVPGAGAVVTTTKPTFLWSPALGALSYNLTVVDTVTGVTVISQQNLATTSYSAPGTPLKSGDTYSWTVSAVTADGQAAPAQPALPFAVIPVPGPTGPSGITDVNRPTFSWSAVPGAAGYNLQVFDTTSATIVINTQVISNNSYTPSTPLKNLDTYDWTVSAYSSASYHGLPYVSPVSGSVYFTVNVDVPPVLITPANQAVLTTTTPEFDWSDVSSAVGYSVTIIDSESGVVAASGPDVTGTSFTPTAPLSYGNYKWFVAPLFPVGTSTITGPQSSVGYFSVDQVGDPVLLNPLPGTTVATATPTLQWSSVAGATGYALSLFDITADAPVISDLPVSSSGSDNVALPVPTPLANGHTYQWTVATGALTISPTAAEFTVSVPHGGSQALGTPVLIGPSGVITQASPTFQWQAVPGASEYVFSLFLVEFPGSLTSFGLPVLVRGTSYAPTLNAYLDDTFICSVTAYDANGNFSVRSAPLDFEFSYQFSSYPPPAGSDPPILVTPGGTVTSYVTAFSWVPIPAFPTNFPTTYDLLVIDETLGTPLFDLPVATSAGQPISFTNSLAFVNNHSYRWYVFGIYPLLPAASQTFTVSAPPIDIPLPVGPAAGTTVTTTTPTFQWSPIAGATNYTLRFEDVTDPLGSFFSGISVTGTTYTPSLPLINGHTYQWSVNAIEVLDSLNVPGTSSSLSRFTVSVPGPPTLQSPAAGASVKVATPTFHWSPVPGASGYDLYLDDTATSTHILSGFPVISTSYALVAPLTSGDSYQWYVRAFDNYGNVGLAPPALNFSVSVPPPVPVVPVLIGPIATITGATPTFQWMPVPGAAAYAIFIEDKATGNIIYGGAHVYGLSYTPPNPLPGGDTTYDWYIQAIYSDGTLGPKPPDADFDVSTAPALPAAPAPISPSGLVTATTPTFTWSAVAGAQGYKLEIFDTTNAKAVPVPLAPQVSTSTSAVLGVALTPGRSYQWQVLAYGNPGSLSPASNPVSFSIQVPPPPPHVTGMTVTHVGKKIKAITVTFDEALSGIGSSSARFFQLSQRTKAGKHPVYRPINDGPITYNPVKHTVRVQLRKPAVGPIRIIVVGGIQAANGTLGSDSAPVTRS